MPYPLPGSNVFQPAFAEVFRASNPLVCPPSARIKQNLKARSVNISTRGKAHEKNQSTLLQPRSTAIDITSKTKRRMARHQVVISTLITAKTSTSPRNYFSRVVPDIISCFFPQNDPETSGAKSFRCVHGDSVKCTSISSRDSSKSFRRGRIHLILFCETTKRKSRSADTGPCPCPCSCSDHNRRNTEQGFACEHKNSHAGAIHVLQGKSSSGNKHSGKASLNELCKWNRPEADTSQGIFIQYNSSNLPY